MVISGMLGAALPALQSAVLPGNWDAAGFGIGYYGAARGAVVSQEFSRRFSQIDYKIQRQSLHREDIEDLMALTLNRTNTYSVVTALLLTFAVTWATDNAVVSDARLPSIPKRWYATVFMLTLISSCAYLTFSLFFAMYASIASQALGTQMRTRVARLSIPSQDEIYRIQVCFSKLDPSLLATLDSPRSDHCDEGSLPEDMRAASEMGRIRAGVSSRPQKLSKSAGAQELGTSGVEDSFEEGNDSSVEWHFRHWLVQQMQWLPYEAYSRLCMVCGVQDLLDALSYDVLAKLHGVSPFSAVVAPLALQWLACFLGMIDDPRALSPVDGLLDFFFRCMPLLIAYLLLSYVNLTPGLAWLQIQLGNSQAPAGGSSLDYLAVSVLWLKAARNWLTVRKLNSMPSTSRGEKDCGTPETDDDIKEISAAMGLGSLPLKSKAVQVQYFNVLGLTQQCDSAFKSEMLSNMDRTPKLLIQRFFLGYSWLWLLAGIVFMAETFWLDQQSSAVLLSNATQAPKHNLRHLASTDQWI
eukprot:CAMPEP_0197674578 /NCGR_PEP_ID=MMETSP1338-20131121/83240_1 /TAXON_ID=43686 ORGANISM="Pelagodinium beii, Strain RCC1491" /NCGR_SAMPLE_ID=MMETSP1338 /ASSEMBLY_ACC=CAM_ASM_000754 /LENGTH=524 /DNA_ID=CAMNT_0043255009 /DNA_START=42 /DNA_END=1616 /DNA_ORIENTATION=-